MDVEIPARASSRYAGRYRTTSDVSALFRVLRDAIRAALTSGVPETASAQFELAIECYHRLVELSLPDEIRAELSSFVEELVARFPDASRANAAAAEVERANVSAALPAAGQEVLVPEQALSVVAGDDLGRLDELADSDEPLVLEATASAVPPGPHVELELVERASVHLATLEASHGVLQQLLVRTDRELSGVTLELVADPPIFSAASLRIESLRPDRPLELGARHLARWLTHDVALLHGLTERRRGGVVARVLQDDGETLAEARAEWTLFPADTWFGLGALPELLAAFVLPNDPAIAEVLGDAAKRLDASTGSPSLDGYATKDPARALRMAEAVYGALQDAEITYATPPASFESEGQRVRFPSSVRTTKLATCLDISLVAAAALEQAGLHPVLVLVEGHAFVGVWLVERTFANPALDEPIRLTKRVELAEIVVFDPTLATSRPTPDFAGAREAAEGALEDRDAFRAAIDVHRARLGGVRPLSSERGADAGQAGGVPQRDAAPTRSLRDLDAELRELQEAARLRRDEDETAETRLDRWLRQLLDLTMRNRLLNSARRSKRVLPLVGAGLAAIEDRLADGKSFKLVERPKELDGDGAALDDPEVAARVAPLLNEGIRTGRLHSTLTPRELEERLIELYREARTAREEGGANSLYLAVGFLSYREAKGSSKERRAPLLLLPVELRRTSARSGYTLVQGVDEPRLNVTLLEYLRRDHRIDVLGLDPLPLDDKGVDVALVLRVFKDAIKDEGDWEVKSEAEVGLYSFSKYLLWRDLSDRSDVLRSNELVAHLLDRPSEPFPAKKGIPDPATLDERFGASEVFAPMSYDSSQLAAILAAADGQTLVLEGPPGTGKSQTITNLIAHAIAHGRTVLFVSEKMAALEVVHKRLRGLGLGPACLELHSNKAGKKAVLEQFQEALDEGRLRGKRRRGWGELAGDVESARRRLNEHVVAMHGERTSGESVHGVVARSATRAGGPDAEAFDFWLEDPRTVDESLLSRWRARLEEIDVIALREAVATDHPLHQVARTDYSPLVEAETRRQLVAFDAPATAFLAAGQRLVDALGFAEVPPPGDADWQRAIELARHAEAVEWLGDGARGALTRPSELDEVEAGLDRIDELEGLRRQFDERFRVSPVTLDLAELERIRRERDGGGWFKRWRRGAALAGAFRGIAKSPRGIDANLAVATLEQAQRAQELEPLVRAEARAVASVLGAAQDATSGTSMPRGRLAEARALAAALHGYAGGARQEPAAVVAAYLDSARPEEALVAVGAFEPCFTELIRARALIVEAACPAAGVSLESSLADVATLQQYARRWADAWRGLRGWCQWQALRSEAVTDGLAPLVEALESGRVPLGGARDGFDAAFDRAWTLHEVSADPNLRAFDGVEHNRAIERYRALDEERLDAAREEVRQRASAARPRPAAVAEAKDVSPRGGAAKTGLGLLQREITKKTRHVAIRRLLAELGEVAMELKPCFLMSPMSVAQYLDAEHPPFDLVVFDEASQIPVWDAIGAIARGRQAVIVGDPKQLPPTSFFSRGEDESVSEDDVQDLESILDECLAARVPTHRLEWHYRSRHESLIAFSNARYYDSRLTTFPSGSSTGSGVSHRYVEGGVYDKGRTRTNRVEAEAVVAEVVRRLLDPELSQRSIGVVTFSQPQQTLMMDLLDAAQREHRGIERFFDDASPDAVFVKNLENVQGDERDVIVFSIGYGPDASGRVSMNFGPLNKDGGERRLNVAVTRARQEVLVFTSLRSEQIDLARTAARGVRDLQAFLRFAERGGRNDREAQEAVRRADGVVGALAGRLAELGWEVETGVGASEVKLDLAVRREGVPGEYLLGVVTDGGSYANAATARDRDRLREDVLRGLGWEIERVWELDWWRDADAEVARIDARLHGLAAQTRD